MCEQCVQLLNNKNTFLGCVEHFHKNPPRNWVEALNEYAELMRELHSGNYPQLLEDDSFLARTYRVLKKFLELGGPKGARKALITQEEFIAWVKENENHKKLTSLSQIKLHQIPNESWCDVRRQLVDLFQKTGKRLSTGSKMLHFLLPDLVPPMDRAYIQKYFQRYYQIGKGGDAEKFANILDCFFQACKNLQLGDGDLQTWRWIWNTSIPKMIDNAIVGCLRSCKSAERSLRTEQGLKERIQQFVYENHIKPALERGDREITVTAGQIHKEMKLRDRIPSVCHALETLKEFGEFEFTVEVQRKEGVKKYSSTNKYIIRLSGQKTRETVAI